MQAPISRYSPSIARHSRSAQHGRFIPGLIVGLLIGLTLALGVAMYVTKVPIPFINKVPLRSAEQDAAEAERNKNWDPNAALQGKAGGRAASAASAASAGASGGTAGGTSAAATSAPPAAPNATPPATPSATGSAGPSAPGTPRDPAAILAGAAEVVSPVASAAAPAKGGRPAAADTALYLLQAGAFQRAEDAEAQRARLGMLGVESKVVDREQTAGRTVYRVRIGPFDRRADAEAVKERLNGAGVDSVLMRMERAPQ